MRTVVYARYSSQLQNARSIDDQVADCRARCEREGWTIVDVFADYAISGAAGLETSQRPGLGALLDRVAAGGIEQVLTESTDRIARHQGDDFIIRERLLFAGCRLFTLMEGEVDEITGTFKGLMNARFRKDLGDRTRRGQRGAVAQGRVSGGIAYGYRRANRIDERGELVRGLREIDEEQAAIVVRIFTEYAAGRSPRAIAERLNVEGVPPPGHADSWRGSTILGDRQRNTGLLNNRTYAGMLVYNRTRKITDPQTRQRLIRPNPESAWSTQPVPELRIVTDALWQAVRDRREECAHVPAEQQRRPKHLLSGLARCGVCGGGVVRHAKDYWRCSRRKDGRGCSVGISIRTDRFESEVLEQLTGRLLNPDLVNAYVREYHREHARRAGDMQRDRARTERKLAEAQRRVDRLVRTIADGGGEFAEFREMLSAAKSERDLAQRALGEIDALPVLALHPGIAEQYRKEVVALQAALDHPEAQLEAVPRLRALIDTITLTPDAAGTKLLVDVTGRMDRIMDLATTARPQATTPKRPRIASVR